MKILVTGGAGFVGTNLVKHLKTINNVKEVISIDNYSTGLKQNHQEGVQYLEYDIREFYDYSQLKPDVVFHLAGIARIQPSFENPREYFEVNANGTMQLVHWCASEGVPLVYAGTSSKHSGKFKNPYTFSKEIGEEIINLYKIHYNLKATIARFYNVYGPYQLLEGGYTTLIGRWLNNIKENKPCYIYGDGEQRRDFTHVDDIVNALVLILQKQAYGYEFELGRGKNYSVNEVAKMLNIQPIYQDSKPGEAKETLNTDDRANKVLGWEPKIDLQNYLESIIHEDHIRHTF